jgi:hypothetical protein
MQKSLAYARQAVADWPEAVLPRLGLAETLIALGQKAEARQVLNAALSLPGSRDEQPETKDDQAKAGKLLEQIN